MNNNNKVCIRIFSVSLTVVVFLLSCKAQSETTNKKGKSYVQVRVLDWRQRGIINGDDLYTNTKDEIIKQIGADEFANFEKHDDQYGWPESLKKNLFDKTDTAARRKVDENYKKLKVYKIATYDHVFGGKNWGKYVILKAPYNENSFLDSPGKWDAVYFIMEEKYVEDIQ